MRKKSTVNVGVFHAAVSVMFLSIPLASTVLAEEELPNAMIRPRFGKSVNGWYPGRDDQMPTGQFEASKMAEFKSAQGFSIRYPEGWFIASKETQDQMTSELKEALGKIGNVDWNRMAVVIVGPLDDDKIESVNVVVAPMRLDLDTLDPDRFARNLARMAGRLGLTSRNVSGSVAEYGGNSGASVHWDVRTPTEVVHQWQFYVPGRSQTYIVTCGCGETERKKYEPIFRAMLDSLRVDVNNRK